MQSALVGIVVPNEAAVRSWATANGFARFDWLQLCGGTADAADSAGSGAPATATAELEGAQRALTAAILSALHRVGQTAGLLKFEQVESLPV